MKNPNNPRVDWAARIAMLEGELEAAYKRAVEAERDAWAADAGIGRYAREVFDRLIDDLAAERVDAFAAWQDAEHEAWCSRNPAERVQYSRFAMR